MNPRDFHSSSFVNLLFVWRFIVPANVGRACLWSKSQLMHTSLAQSVNSTNFGFSPTSCIAKACDRIFPCCFRPILTSFLHMSSLPTSSLAIPSHLIPSLFCVFPSFCHSEWTLGRHATVCPRRRLCSAVRRSTNRSVASKGRCKKDLPLGLDGIEPQSHPPFRFSGYLSF